MILLYDEMFKFGDNMIKFVLLVTLMGATLLVANSAPVVSNMSAAQRTDGSCLVDVHYSVQDTDGDPLQISMLVSSDGGTTWNISCDLLSGDIGANISPGTNKHIIWDVGMEHPDIVANYHFKIVADDGQLLPDTLLLDLIAYWKLDESQGQILFESTGNSYNFDVMSSGATFNSQFEWTQGLISSGLKRKPSGDMLRYIRSSTFNQDVLPKDDFTYNIWIKGEIQNISNHMYILLWSSLYAVYFRISPPSEGQNYYGSLSAYSWATTSVGDYPFVVRSCDMLLMNNVWHMLTLTRIKSSNNNDIKLYVDGLEVQGYLEQLNWNKSIIYRDGTLTLGGGNQGGQVLFSNGQYDELGIWSRALNDSEVQFLYNNGVGKQYPF